ncbi:four helix bundle protein [Flavobacterium pectinovorum]|jgi:four helix bundle protein|uniref:Four helix bundle protein n=1 Tax=Flavobacterium pectinovorum TaxID=29533 RepID=A0A502ENX2_9FLAO|nr:four helix bundle protein [Flavobacterium pectinovorum]TPG38742.1 four helix bundle protein [Flavobacterium pectinovorum]
MSSLKSFEDLECWKAARELRIFVSQNIIPKFSIEEKYALTSQLRRSSRSVSDNIAEGYGRYHYQENIQFCRIARGSLTEALNQVITAMDENYIEEDLLQQFRERFERTKAILNGYINYLAKTKMM